ncbi:AraC family transcriptional regulator [Parapedobacter pyrenivorans]|uniref:AraC family transcriptional regulator n=1 Tax=Parapedobacter pyrenivorans TaxID=1305674 RepID=A0A917MDB2_9SPHI|nr:AraC family transcriptional regulator [Parapedobacter pyrenivorans]GGG95716.1 AraC family transcriptional regulator [Parapedobacter pyrenivorans]
MKKTNASIPYYMEINDFLETLPLPGRTTNALLYSRELKKTGPKIEIYRPPFRRAFYFFALFLNSGKIQVKYDDKTVNNPEAYLVCHSPDLIYSFSKADALEGYIFYFKPECFSFFKPSFHKEFPFFNRLYTNLFTLNQATYHKLAPHFEEVFIAYERSSDEAHIEARLKLLALLYRVKAFVNEQHDATRFASPDQGLLSKYLHLVDSHYIEKRTVKEYADLLSITPNHLSQTIKAVSGKKALSYITERLVREAKSLLLYTDFSISEIAYRLGFSDPANFGKFFKKESGMPPSKFTG